MGSRSVAVSRAGSSPLMRGTPRRARGRATWPRIIHAYAGSTTRPARGDGRAADHPRSCREHALRVDRRRDKPGSSPLMRGAQSLTSMFAGQSTSTEPSLHVRGPEMEHGHRNCVVKLVSAISVAGNLAPCWRNQVATSTCSQSKAHMRHVERVLELWILRGSAAARARRSRAIVLQASQSVASRSGA